MLLDIGCRLRTVTPLGTAVGVAQEVVAAAEKDDPKVLRRRVAELERELTKERKTLDATAAVAQRRAIEKRVEVPVLGERDLKRIDKAAEVLANSAAVVAALLVEEKGQLAAAARPPLALPRPSTPGASARSPLQGGHPGTTPRRVAPPPASARTDDGAPGKGELRILAAVAQHHEGVTREQLTVLTGYRRSSRDTYLQRFRSRELILDGERITVTDAGLAELGPDFESLPTGAALLEHWRQKLPQGERAVLDVVVAAYPEAADREAISEATGYQRSSRDTYLQRLRSRQLVMDAGRGQVRASETLFGAR